MAEMVKPRNKNKTHGGMAGAEQRRILDRVTACEDMLNKPNDSRWMKLRWRTATHQRPPSGLHNRLSNPLWVHPVWHLICIKYRAGMYYRQHWLKNDGRREFVSDVSQFENVSPCQFWCNGSVIGQLSAGICWMRWVTSRVEVFKYSMVSED